MLNVIPISAFKDNYIWALINPVNNSCAVVDPGDAMPVVDFLEKQELTLCAILITHHHHDHTGGILPLLKKFPAIPTYGPANEQIIGVNQPVAQDDKIVIPALELTLVVYDIPGHTKGHIAYYGDSMLFCGDTLFAAGCGRLFEGTASEMVQSLTKISRLPDDTRIYCAHEYTAANLQFAKMIEPENNAITTRIHQVKLLLEQHYPTLPTNLQLEKLTNPFLRCHKDSVIHSVRSKLNNQSTDPVSIFQALRAWKDTF